MNDSTFDRLKQFIVDRVGVYEEEVKPESRLYDDLGVYGDDATELLIEYGKKFKVDVSKFMAADYWLKDVLTRIAAHLISKIAELLPHNWTPIL